MPAFSVVIPLYNKADTIERTLRSIAQQTYHDFEVIIIDDGSTDGSAEVVQNLSLKIPLTLIKQKNSGVSVARNKGAEVAHGKFLAFIDADDEWMAEYLQGVFSAHRCYPAARVIGTDYEAVYPDKIVSGRDKNIIEMVDFFKEWPIRSPIHTSSLCIDRSFFLSIGGFKRGCRFFEDAELLFRLAQADGMFAVNRRVLARYNCDAVERATGRGIPMLEYPHLLWAEKMLEDNNVLSAGLLKCLRSLFLRAYLANSRRLLVRGNKDLARRYPHICDDMILRLLTSYIISVITLPINLALAVYFRWLYFRRTKCIKKNAF